jgi:hypothetical protein
MPYTEEGWVLDYHDALVQLRSVCHLHAEIHGACGCDSCMDCKDIEKLLTNLRSVTWDERETKAKVTL